MFGGDGSPLENAYLFVCGLTVGCASGFTDATGTWAFHHVRPDSYLVRAWHGEHVGGLFGSGAFATDEAHAKQITVSTASITGLDIVLPGGASITGHLGGPLGEDVAGAGINALGTGEIWPANPGGDTTAADGSFTLRGLTEDDYVISISFEPGSDYLRGYYDAGSPDGYTDDYDSATLVSIGDAAVGSS